MYCKGCQYEEPKEGGYCYMWQDEPTACVYSKKYYCPACGGEGIVEEQHEDGSCMVECYCNGGFVPFVKRYSNEQTH